MVKDLKAFASVVYPFLEVSINLFPVYKDNFLYVNKELDTERADALAIYLLATGGCCLQALCVYKSAITIA